MENSNSFFSNSAKSFDNSQLNINPFKNKIKKSMKHFSNINTNFYLKKNNSASNIFLEKTAQTSLAKNSVEILNIYNRFTPSCLRRNKKYGNFYIFGKREIALNKSIQEGKLVFKYHQSIGIEKKPENNNKIINFNKLSDSLYLTESIPKTTKHKTTLPLIEKDKSLLEEDKSFSINKNKYISCSRNSNVNLSPIDNNLNINKEEENSNNNNIINQKGIIYLKKITLNKDKEKEHFEKRDLALNRTLIKKINVLDKSIGYKSLNQYVQDFRDLLLDKYNHNIKSEKVKVLNENRENKLNKTKDDLRDIQNNSDLFLKQFYPKFNEYIKFFEKLREIERQKDLSYVNKIYLLEKRISTIKNKINKRQLEKEYLIKEMLLQISIQEKNLHLPKYYVDILIKDLSFEEIKEKYGNEVNQEEYNRVLKYKQSIEGNEMESIFEKLNILTNENIELINAYNKIHANNLKYKKLREKTEKEIKNSIQNEINKSIAKKERQLKVVIQKYQNTEKDLNNILKSKEYSPKDNNTRLNHSNLYLTVEMMLNNLDESLNYEFNINDKIRGKITEEKIILQKIRRIEIYVTKFLAQYNEDKIKEPKKVKYFKNMYDKERKIKKALELKKNNFVKLEKERQKIIERYNKILFLKNKKIYLIKPNKKAVIDKESTKYEEKGEKIEHFLYD